MLTNFQMVLDEDDPMALNLLKYVLRTEYMSDPNTIERVNEILKEDDRKLIESYIELIRHDDRNYYDRVDERLEEK